MGMKKSNVLGLIGFAMALSAQSDEFNITERGKVPEPPLPKKPKELTPFRKQEGISKMIKEYSLIKKGESKKGITKQVRVKSKIDYWLKTGALKEEDLD